jgi:hypothetical protein
MLSSRSFATSNGWTLDNARGYGNGYGCKAGRSDMTVDEVILKALESGDPVTVNDVLKRFADRVRMRLEKLRVRGVVVREGRGRPHREFTYKLVRPDRAAKAIGETGGALSRGPKREKNRDSGFHHEV